MCTGHTVETRSDNVIWRCGSHWFWHCQCENSDSYYKQPIKQCFSPCRKYVPEVKDLPMDYVFEPWKAPECVQQAAGCLLGTHYPLPVVDHEEQRRVCVQRLKEIAESVGESIGGMLIV